MFRDQHEARAAATGQSFNLFAVLDRETDEVQTHSAIICELLNKDGSHNQGAVFARLFAQRLGLNADEIARASVWRETTVTEGSRADIVIQTGRTCIVIENKIYAGDQPRQLARYHDYARRWAEWKLLYLTLHGHAPTDESLGELSGDDVTCISYESDIMAWLDECIKEVARLPQLRETLAHYQALLRKLTGTLTGELTMDLKKLLTEKHGGTYNFALVPDLAAALKALSIEQEWKFWEDLTRLLTEPDDRLTVLAEVTDMKEVTEDVVGHAHGTGRKKWYYGRTFQIRLGEPSPYGDDHTEAMFRVEVDHQGCLFYGLIGMEHTSKGPRQMRRSDGHSLFDDWQRLALPGSDWYVDDEWWLAWKWPRKPVALWKEPGTYLEPSTIRQLIRGKRLRSLAAEVQTSLDEIERALSDSGE